VRLPEPLGALKRPYAILPVSYREEKSLEKNQPRLFPIPHPEKYIAPPSHVVIFSLHEGQFVILSQERTGIKGIPVRPTFIRHRKGKNPKWEARMLSRYFYEKSEAGKLGHKNLKSDEILV
jgi:hypothetical protein